MIQELPITQNISIEPETTILEAIRKMDETDRKLLIVLEEEKFIGLLSIGDVQRALIKNQDFSIPVGRILRKEITIAYQDQAESEIKKMMLQHRTEFMPVLDEVGTLVNVLFWNDLFDEERPVERVVENIPVVIMAGGKGTRLKPLTNIIPKPLIPLGDRTILEVIIDSFKKMGSNNF
ncbi:MAG: CBS domain-containing protein, partial [Bacteroidota bacterium]